MEGEIVGKYENENQSSVGILIYYKDLGRFF